jgi:uncharacterized protein
LVFALSDERERGIPRERQYMLTHLTDPAKALIYFILAFALCAGVIALAPVSENVALKLVMGTPLVAVALMLLVVTRDGATREGWAALGLHRAGIKGWGLALAVPLIVLTFAYAAAWGSGVGTFAVPGDIQSPPDYLLDVVVSIVIVTLMGGIGEEIGWRGYMLPHLLKLGATPALLISGFAHGLFHLPAILGTSAYHGAGDPVIIVPLFLATLTMAGVCYGYLRLTTGSVWPAALAHSAFNIFWDRLSGLTVTDDPAALDYLAGESGVATLIALTAVAAWLAYRLPAHLQHAKT